MFIIKVWGVIMTSSKEILKIAEVHYAVNKMLTALEIIKSKGIDIDALKYHKDLEHYNFSLRGRFEQLTQEEYDLLKEVLL